MLKALMLLLGLAAAAVAGSVVCYYCMQPAIPQGGIPKGAALSGPAREFAVEGMTCQGCVETITAALGKLPGVQSVKVLLAEKKAWVVADRAQVPDAQIIAAITAAGYTGRAATSAPVAETAAAPAPAVQTEPAASAEAEIPRNLGEPLVDDPQSLKRLDKLSPVWLDKPRRAVVLLGTTCKAGYPLEFFATYPDRSYESVLSVYTRPSVVHAALLALGAKPGRPVAYEPKFTPPTGTVVDIDVVWKDAGGKRQKARAQEWVRDIKTKKPLDVSWVFAGSRFYEDKEAGIKSYVADRGDFISVLNLPTSMLDVPIKSASALEARLFEGTEHMPKPGTPVTIILTPKLEAAKK